MKVKGLEEFTRTLDDAQKALQGLDGELGSVSFDPNDPSSIEAAISRMEAMVDERLGRFSRNPIIAPLISGMKEQYRKGILDRAAAARLGKGDE
jgi:hypothetical protein